MMMLLLLYDKVHILENGWFLGCLVLHVEMFIFVSFMLVIDFACFASRSLRWLFSLLSILFISLHSIIPFRFAQFNWIDFSQYEVYVSTYLCTYVVWSSKYPSYVLKVLYEIG